MTDMDRDRRTEPRPEGDYALSRIVVTLEYIQRDLASLEKEFGSNIAEMKADMKTLQKGFITKEEFEPVKRLVYGLVSLTMVAVVGALISLVLK